MKTFVELSLLRLRRKVRCGALQQMALQKQDFRFSPKDGDGNSASINAHNQSLYFRFSPKDGDGNYKIRQVVRLHLHDFRFSPKDGDGNLSTFCFSFRKAFILDLAPKMGTETNLVFFGLEILGNIF